MVSRTFFKVLKDIARFQKRGLTASNRSCFAATTEIGEPEVDIEYLVDPANRVQIEDNITKRREFNNLPLIVGLYEQLQVESDSSKREELLRTLREEAGKVPNSTHPDVRQLSDKPKVIFSKNLVKNCINPKTFNELVKDLGILRMEHLTTMTGRRTYYFAGHLSELEHALIKFTISQLLQMNFRLISVPDILPGHVFDRCGMNTKGERTQIFQLDDCHGKDIYLSGTAEMGIAYLYANKIVDVDDLPLCLVAVSRCHRAELSSVKEEQGLFRVHQFTKVEMFGISHPNHSEELFQRFVDVQQKLFTSLGLIFRVLDMPIHELGAPAYRKFDIEAWFPGKGYYGEVSSCSNCTDYQSRRLNIKFRNKDYVKHVHTVNATACAVPRTIMAMFETHQLEDGSIAIPDLLQPYFHGRKIIENEKLVDEQQSEECKGM